MEDRTFYITIVIVIIIAIGMVCSVAVYTTYFAPKKVVNVVGNNQNPDVNVTGTSADTGSNQSSSSSSSSHSSSNNGIKQDGNDGYWDANGYYHDTGETHQGKYGTVNGQDAYYDQNSHSYVPADQYINEYGTDSIGD